MSLAPRLVWEELPARLAPLVLLDSSDGEGGARWVAKAGFRSERAAVVPQRGIAPNAHLLEPTRERLESGA